MCAPAGTYQVAERAAGASPRPTGVRSFGAASVFRPTGGHKGRPYIPSTVIASQPADWRGNPLFFLGPGASVPVPGPAGGHVGPPLQGIPIVSCP